MKMVHINCPAHAEASLEGYILDCELRLGQEKKRPAILVCPGGGYMYCSPREAEPVALSYAANGFHAFILRYSVGKDAAGFTPLEEVSWAIGLIREKAEEWNIDGDKIVTCGFSAGGHLALAAGVLGQNKPNAMILGYPAVILPNYPGVDFMLKLLTGKEQVTDEDSKALSLVEHITKEAPPVFMVATAQDMLTAYGALPVAQKYTALGKTYELHIFEHGPHGYSLANETSCDGSSQFVNSAFAQWQALSVQWLYQVFGKPVLEDRNTGRISKMLAEMGISLNGPIS